MKNHSSLDSSSVMVCTIQCICDHNLGWGSKCQEAKENAKIFSLSAVKSLLSPVSPPQPCLFAHTSLHLSPLIVNHAHTVGIPYIDIILESACTQLTVLASQSDITSIPLSSCGGGRCEKHICEFDYNPWGVLHKTYYACLVSIKPWTPMGN